MVLAIKKVCNDISPTRQRWLIALDQENQILERGSLT